MLRKLLKYDLRSMLKTFLLLWAAILAVSAVNRLTMFDITNAASYRAIPMLVYFGVMVALVVLTILTIVQRFYNGLLRDEGYLMFTLPVRPWQLITAKGLSAFLLTLLSLLVSVLSVMIMIPFDALRFSFQGFFEYYFSDAAHAVMLAELLLVAFTVIAKTIYQVYAAIALGHLFRKNRVAMSFVMFVAISVALSVFYSILTAVYPYADQLYDGISMVGYDVIPHLSFLGSFLINLVPLAAFHIITDRILSKRLNLE